MRHHFLFDFPVIPVIPVIFSNIFENIKKFLPNYKHDSAQAEETAPRLGFYATRKDKERNRT